MTAEQIVSACNTQVREGFCEVNQQWRRYAVIHPARRFTVAGANSLETYGKLFAFNKAEIESGQHLQMAHRLGRSAAFNLNEIIWKEVGRFGGPESLEALAYLTESSVDRLMESIDIRVDFLHGQQWPVLELCEVDSDGNCAMRGFHDFGVTVQKRELR